MERDGERRPEIRVGTSSVTVDSARNKKKEEKGKICDVDVDSQKLCSQTSTKAREELMVVWKQHCPGGRVDSPSRSPGNVLTEMGPCFDRGSWIWNKL